MDENNADISNASVPRLTELLAPRESFAGYFSKSTFFEKNLPGISSECQTGWILIRPDTQMVFLLGLIRAQTVCKSYQQTTLRDKELILNSSLMPIYTKTRKRRVLRPADFTSISLRVYEHERYTHSRHTQCCFQGIIQFFRNLFLVCLLCSMSQMVI